MRTTVVDDEYLPLESMCVCGVRLHTAGNCEGREWSDEGRCTCRERSSRAHSLHLKAEGSSDHRHACIYTLAWLAAERVRSRVRRKRRGLESGKPW